MVDPLAVINATVSTVTKLTTLAGTIKNADLKLLVADLTLEIAQTKTTMAALIDDNRQLKATISAYNTPKTSVQVKDGLYFTDNDGPFCIACFDDKNKLIRISEVSGHFNVFGKYKCPVCAAYYGPTSN
mgnify:CR=1 FL=1